MEHSEMSDTPRTDAAIVQARYDPSAGIWDISPEPSGWVEDYVPAEFARELERELAEFRKVKIGEYDAESLPF